MDKIVLSQITVHSVEKHNTIQSDIPSILSLTADLDFFLFSLRHLWRPLYLPAHTNHRQQLQQVLREGQDRGGDHGKEEKILVGRTEKRHGSAGGEKC